MIAWLDLYTADDPHPRRFDSPAALRYYLEKMERLDEESILSLLEFGAISPPQSRRIYRVQRLDSVLAVAPAHE